MTSGELSGCIIVSGMPGGKSTVTSLAAALLRRAVQVKGDDVKQMIHSGRVGFMDKPKEEALRQHGLCDRNMCSLANNFIDFGFTVFMDTVVADRRELDLLLALLSPRPARLITLAPAETADRLVLEAAVRAVPLQGGWHMRLAHLHHAEAPDSGSSQP